MNLVVQRARHPELKDYIHTAVTALQPFIQMEKNKKSKFAAPPKAKQRKRTMNSEDGGGMAMNNTGTSPPMGIRGMPMMMHHKMMMHMSFFWGKNTEVLFHGWPGTSTGMYVLALIVVFTLAMLVEWLSNSRIIKESTNQIVAGFLQTIMHTLRVGLAYMLMLAIMSFNAGVFLVAVAGHMLGFLLFGSRVFNPNAAAAAAAGANHHYEKHSTTDLPPMSC